MQLKSVRLNHLQSGRACITKLKLVLVFIITTISSQKTAECSKGLLENMLATVVFYNGDVQVYSVGASL